MRCQVYIPKELEEVLLNDAKKAGVNAVSYTHLTLPTKA